MKIWKVTSTRPPNEPIITIVVAKTKEDAAYYASKIGYINSTIIEMGISNWQMKEGDIL